MRKQYQNTNNSETIERSTKRLCIYATIILLFVFFIIILICAYIGSKSKYDLKFEETANIDYKVHLHENDFYDEEYRESNKQYVASLIKNIIANFKYNFELKEDNSFNYTYRIDAIINIEDTKTKNSLYENTKTLLEEKQLTSEGNKININEELNIDYVYYNELATKFINQYKLVSATESTLDIMLYVNTDYTQQSIITLSIPLATKTVAMNVQKQLASTANTKIINVQNNKILQYGTITGIVLLLAGIGVTIYLLIQYLLDTRTEETVYNSEKRKIIMTYGSVIDKVDEYDMKFDEYHIIKLNTFNDLVRIKEDLSQPILMVENKEKTNTIFFIPNSTKFIYMFVLGTQHELLAEKNQEYSEVVVGNENDK